MRKRDPMALRHHPRHNTPLRLAAGLVMQVVSWQVSRLVDRGRFDPARIDVHRFDLPLPGLAAAFDGFRLVHISDIHMGTWMNAARLAGIVDLVNAEKPDLIAITGDFVSYTIEQPLTELVGPLSRLQAPHGVFAVLGNHDCWTDSEKVRAALAASAIRDLPNTAVTLHRGADCLHIAGVDNVYDGRADLPRLLASLPPDGPAILLAHEPDFADEAAASGRFALQLSGHSHGGQLNLPLIGPPFLPHLAKKYPRGRYQVGTMVLYTNRGLGTTALQLRVRCPPEIAVITLRSC